MAIQAKQLAWLSSAKVKDLHTTISRRLKNSYQKLSKGVFDLQNYVCYYHDEEPSVKKRKGVSSIIKAADGRYVLNLSVQLREGTLDS